MVRHGHGRGGGQILEVDEMLVEPLAVRAVTGELLLDLLVLDDAALLGVHEEHAARLQAPLAEDVFRRDVEHAGLRRHDHEAVLGQAVARRPQAVAVENGANLLAVGEANRGGTVPRLHQTGVILVERAPGVVHVLVARPRLGDHHHDRVRERPAGKDEELERVVEHRRVAAVRVHDREQLLDVVAEEFRLKQRLAGVHPVDVAAERVDLAVVRDVAVRVRAVPAGEGVGREARVDKADRGFHRGVLQVGEIFRELVGQQHALVDDRLAGEAGDVPRLRAAHRRGADVAVGALADDVERTFEGHVVGQRRVAADEHLAHERLAGLGGLAEGGIVRRHRAPAEEGLPLGLHDALEALLDLAADGRVAREENDAGAILAGRGQREARLLADLGKELVRDLQEHAGAVAGVGFAAGGAAVVEVGQDLQRLLQDRVGLAPLQVRHKADAAGIVFKRRIVKSLLAGSAGGGELGGQGKGTGARVVRHQGGENGSGKCAGSAGRGRSGGKKRAGRILREPAREG